MRNAARIVLTLALVTLAGAANRLRLVREDDSTADAGPEKRPVPEIQVFDDFSSIGPEQRDAWLSIWSTQAWVGCSGRVGALLRRGGVRGAAWGRGGDGVSNTCASSNVHPRDAPGSMGLPCLCAVSRL